MWFKRASKNRRLGREFVLDVKLRSSQVRAKRMRVAAIVLGSVFATLASLYLVWRAGDWALNVLLYENNAFAVQDIDVQSDGVIAPNQLRRWSGVRLGQNLLALDLLSVRRNLEFVSMVQFVSLEKVLPHTLRVRVIEREPLAQLNIATPRPGGGFDIVPSYLDSDAYVLLPLSPAQCVATTPGPPMNQLPVIVGVNASDLQPGRRLESPQVHAALDLIQAFERSSMQGVAEIKKIDVSTPEVLVVRTGQGSEITFGVRDLDQQLLRWQAVFEKVLSLNKAIASLDLAVSNSIPAILVEASGVPPASDKSPKPVRNRKKHV
jgi:hypothetical protein